MSLDNLKNLSNFTGSTCSLADLIHDSIQDLKSKSVALVALPSDTACLMLGSCMTNTPETERLETDYINPPLTDPLYRSPISQTG